jgi:UDP-2-acetamido-2,6-beta-L-arabino-hexul-4-ose reductase
MVTIEELDIRGDDRGVVFEPLAEEALATQRNAHVVVTRPGAVRGNHVHQLGTETLTVQGPALVRYRDEDGSHDQLVPPGALWRFVFPPGVAHAVRNEAAGPSIMVAFNTMVHTPDDPDAIEARLLEATPPPS